MRADELPVDEAVAHELADDDVARALALPPVEHEGIRQPLLAEADELVVRPDEVAPADEAIVVAVGLDTTKDRVGPIERHDVEDRVLLPQQRDGGEVESPLPRQLVAPVETGGAEELAVREGEPRVVGIVRAQRISDCAKKAHLKIILGHPGVHGSFRVVALLAGHHRGDLGIAFHAHVGIRHAVVHGPLERVEGRSHGNPDPYDEPAFRIVQPFELDQRRYVEQVRVARDVGNVPLDVERRCLGDALHGAIVADAEEYAAALPVGERADGLERVLARLRPAALELDAYALACLDVPVKRITHRCLRLILDIILDMLSLLSRLCPEKCPG